MKRQDAKDAKAFLGFFRIGVKPIRKIAAVLWVFGLRRSFILLQNTQRADWFIESSVPIR